MRLEVLLVALLLVGCANVGAQQQLRAMPVEPVTLTDIQLQTIDTTIRDVMKDPDSVKIKNVVASKREGTIHVCGSVNAKNSYGGYTGFSPFRIDIEEATGRTTIKSMMSANADWLEADMARAMCTAVGLQVSV